MVKWWWSDGEVMVSEVMSCFNSLMIIMNNMYVITIMNIMNTMNNMNINNISNIRNILNTMNNMKWWYDG